MERQLNYFSYILKRCNNIFKELYLWSIPYLKHKSIEQQYKKPQYLSLWHTSLHLCKDLCWIYLLHSWHHLSNCTERQIIHGLGKYFKSYIKVHSYLNLLFCSSLKKFSFFYFSVNLCWIYLPYSSHHLINCTERQIIQGLGTYCFISQLNKIELYFSANLCWISPKQLHSYYVRDAAGFSNPGGLAVMWWA